MKKLKVFTFVLSALMLQSICVNAASSKKSDEYTREELKIEDQDFMLVI